MTTRPRRQHDRKPGPAGVPRTHLGSGAARRRHHRGRRPGRPGPASGRLAYSVDEAARLTGLSRDLLYDEMRRGNLASVKVGRRRLITRQHLQQFLGIAS